jgi:hypothetical protein
MTSQPTMTSKPRRLTGCRITGSDNLVPVLDLGTQALTGVFPRDRDQPVTAGPIDLVLCPDSGLLQLGHSYDHEEMYGMNYGYRSGLNQSMVQHLRAKARTLQRLVPLEAGDIVLDIGSNDATLLSAYDVPGLRRVGIDPTGIKFRDFYTDGIELVPDFFSADAFRSKFPIGKARIVTSIAMFYDLEAPREFVADVEQVLAPDGIWHFEQSYMPAMLRMNAYDTICHEHLEYYSLGVVKRLLEEAGLRVIDVQTNDVNGGSFAVSAARHDAGLATNDVIIDWMLEQEDRLGLNSTRPYHAFRDRVFDHRDRLTSLIRRLNADGNVVAGYGASTKGNVVLQFCGFDTSDIRCIAEVNPDKFGAFTPGTYIPIASEAEVRAMKPDYMIVLPWHFRNSIIARERDYIESGGKLIFPLPDIEIV